MWYEHLLRLSVDSAVIVGFDRDESLALARGQRNSRDDVDVRWVKETPGDASAIDVTVWLTSADAPDDRVTAYIRHALGLPAAHGESAVSVRPPVPAPRSATRGEQFLGIRSAEPSPEARDRRYLHGEFPASVQPGGEFSLLVRVITVDRGGAELRHFEIPAEGRDVQLILYAPEFGPLGQQHRMLHIPQRGDSDPVRFDLRADAPGAPTLSVTAWIGGTYLGELRAEIVVDRYAKEGLARAAVSEVDTHAVPGDVSLFVRYEPRQNLYRFEFHDVDNPDEVTSQLEFEPGPRIEQLIGELDAIVGGESGYSTAERQAYLVNAGARLWQELIPRQIREQFWDRRDRIGQLTILTNNDVVPWELLYPKDEGNDFGFLVEQFPVTRGVFGRRPASRLCLEPARFVMAPDAREYLPNAEREVQVLRSLIDPGDAVEPVSALTPLLDLVHRGDFGLLHFACHNSFESSRGSGIKLDDRWFTPTLLTTAAIQKTMALREPLVFVNACRSAGLAPSYSHLDGWATTFLDAGAGAFIGSLWSVPDRSALDFALEVYRGLLAGIPLGRAVLRARRAAAARPGNPTWLAYSVYGDPHAAVAAPEHGASHDGSVNAPRPRPAPSRATGRSARHLGSG